jgi:hypothetical protein
MSRNIQIAMAAIIASIAIVAIGYYSILFEHEQPKLSYTIESIIERMNIQEGTSVLSCEKSYPDLCIPKGEVTLTCEHILERSFNVTHNDPNNLDPDGNGMGCEP